MTLSRFFLPAILTSFLFSPAFANTEIIVQSTTSTKNSGLYDYILPLIE